MPEADRRLRQVAQLRKLWRAFRDPQERLEDERLARPIISNRPSPSRLQEPPASYGLPAIRAAVRHWWCQGDYAAIVELGERLEPSLLAAEPLIHVYVEEARARLADRRPGA
jgi:hypothetical protein